MEDCIFCKIVKKTIPAKLVYEDDDMLIINDIVPQAKVHYLLIPKAHYADIIELAQADPTLLGRCFATLAKIFPTLNLPDGCRIITNRGAHACQSVQHTHIHILGGEQLSGKMG